MYDIIIVGSGPAGLTAAIYASRGGFRTAVIEQDFMGCGKISDANIIDNYPGFHQISGAELGEKLRSHAQYSGGEYITDQVVKITKSGKIFTVETKDSQPLKCRCVIYSAGTSPRKLNIPGIHLPGIHYCASCDGAFYKDKTAALIGGGNTALSEALYLSKIAKKIFILNRSPNLRGDKILQDAAENSPNITIMRNAVPVKILGKRSVEGILIKHKGAEEKLAVDGVFTAIGSIPDTGPVSGLCSLDKNGFIIAGEDGKTSLDGLFAAGDVRGASLKQIVSAAADGAYAARSAFDFLL